MTALIAEQGRRQRAEQQQRSRLRVVTWNVSVTQPPDQLAQNLEFMLADAGQPHVVALQEAKRYKGAPPGYRRWAADQHPRPEADNNVLLVRRRGVELVRRRVLAIHGPHWTGPHQGREHPPRVYPGVDVRAEGSTVWSLLDVHRVTGGPTGKNADAWLAEDQQLEAWSDQRHLRHRDRQLVLLGDWQLNAKDQRPLAPAGLGRRINGRLLFSGIDGAIVTHAHGHVHQLPRRYGSDTHQPVVITMVTS